MDKELNKNCSDNNEKKCNCGHDHENKECNCGDDHEGCGCGDDHEELWIADMMMIL